MREEMDKTKLEPEEIKMPRKGLLGRLFGNFMEASAEKKIDAAVRKHAVLPDGSVDTELAAYIRKKMIQSKSIGIREVLGPGSWVISLSGAAFAARQSVMNYDSSKQGIDKISGGEGKGLFMAKNLGVLLGAGLIDALRMKSKFNNAMTGELEGALGAMKAERAAEREAERYVDTILEEESGITLERAEKQSLDAIKGAIKHPSGKHESAVERLLSSTNPSSNEISR